MALTGFTPLESVADQYKTPSNAPHTDMHDAEVEAINTIAEAIPEALSDLDGFDTSNSGTIPGRKLLLWDATDSKVILGADADPGGTYLSADDLGTPNGPAQLDSDGKVPADQLPDDLGGSLAVSANGGAALGVPTTLDFVGANSSSLSGGVAHIDVSRADVRTCWLTSDYNFRNSTTATTVTGWDTPSKLTLGNADTDEIWDFIVLARLYSTTAALAKAILTMPTGCVTEYDIWGVHTGVTSASSSDGGQFDVNNLRISAINIPNNGAQQFGGFTSGGSLTPVTVRAEGYVKYPAGTTGDFQLKVAQVNAVDAAGFVAKALATKIILSRRA